jgi:hypothetical protein
LRRTGFDNLHLSDVVALLRAGATGHGGWTVLLRLGLEFPDLPVLDTRLLHRHVASGRPADA